MVTYRDGLPDAYLAYVVSLDELQLFLNSAEGELETNNKN